MNLLNVAKHLLHLAQTEYGFEKSATTNDEFFLAERLYEILKSIKDSHFSELYTYDCLDFDDECDEMTTEEESDDDNDDYDENEDSDIQTHFTLEEMENIIEWVDQHPNAKIATISNRFKKKRAIEKETVHDADLELYAIQKARELTWDTFKASKCFINTFKRENRISSRRYNKIITRTNPNRKFCTLNDAHNWIDSKRTLISKYSSHQILNSDHCSFQQEYIPPRTLSFTGERTTEVAVKKKYNTTHSYTVQPVTSADGHLLDKFLLILQEKENTFGVNVQKKLIVPPNVVVKASKSGKSSDEKHHAFLNEVLRPLVGKKFLLFLDSWKTQADLTKFRAAFPNQDSQLLIFPEGSTGYIQPQDLSLFRSWRFIHEKIEHYIHINRTEMNVLSTPLHSTSTLIRHLRDVHELDEFKSKEKLVYRSKQKRMPVKLKKKLDCALITTIIENGRSFGDFSKSGFQKFIQLALPGNNI
ncbi:unnamed protein product [Rotaria sordida]|uniref:DDE-1 domain-containing protein n=1 Tax=Rotaria sordida TaxID=392033 RepID=A0A815BQR5_9BILA|nr:unnamed protein product [Rotaria sordida]